MSGMDKKLMYIIHHGGYICTWSLKVHLLSWTCEPWCNRHGWPDVKKHGCDMHTKFMSKFFAMDVTCTQSSRVHFLLWTYVTCTQSPWVHLLPWDVHMKLVSTSSTMDYMCKWACHSTRITCTWVHHLPGQPCRHEHTFTMDEICTWSYQDILQAFSLTFRFKAICPQTTCPNWGKLPL